MGEGIGEAGPEGKKGTSGAVWAGSQLALFPILSCTWLGLRDGNKVTGPAEQAQNQTRLGRPISPILLPRNPPKA